MFGLGKDNMKVFQRVEACFSVCIHMKLRNREQAVA